MRRPARKYRVDATLALLGRDSLITFIEAELEVPILVRRQGYLYDRNELARRVEVIRLVLSGVGPSGTLRDADIEERLNR